MTPQEKANTLVEKFVNIETLKDFEGMDEIHAKECALICVDEIIESEVETTRYGIAYLQKRDYWQEVKEEITKL